MQVSNFFNSPDNHLLPPINGKNLFKFSHVKDCKIFFLVLNGSSELLTSDCN